MAKKRLKGLDKVLANLNKEILKIKGRTMKGLIEAARLLREDMERTPPLIPVGKTGNLRASWIANPFYMGNNPLVKIGFTAGYAWFVHEMVDKGSKRINWSRPGSGPKFLEAALKRNKKAMLEEIRREARIL